MIPLKNLFIVVGISFFIALIITFITIYIQGRDEVNNERKGRY